MSWLNLWRHNYKILCKILPLRLVCIHSDKYVCKIMSITFLCRSYNRKMCLSMSSLSTAVWITIWSHMYTFMSINNLLRFYNSTLCDTMPFKKLNFICLWHFWIQWYKWVFRLMSSSLIWLASYLCLRWCMSRSLLWKYNRPQVL